MERIERRLGEIRTSLDACTASNASSMQDLERQVKNVGLAVETEVRLRSEDTNRNMAANNQMKELLTTVESTNTKNNAALQDKIKSFNDVVLEHEKARGLASEEFSKKIKDVAAMIEVERRDRDQSTVSMKSQVEGVKQLIASEKEDRVNELGLFRRNVVVEDGKTQQALHDLRHAIEMECNKREAADNRLDKRCNEHRSALNDATRNRCKMAEELEKVRKGLDHEARSRQDENAKMGGALTHLQEVLDKEVSGCRQVLADSVDRVKMVSENLTRESNERAAGDEELSKLLISVRQAIEKEIKERKGADAETEHLTLELVASTEQERKNRERDDAAVKNQISALRHELTSDKEEHASSVAFCKRGLGMLEGQQTQQFKDLRHAIESETSERIAADKQVDTACTDLRVSIETYRASQNATTKDLERAITKNQQANEAMIRDRTALFEEHAHNFNDLRQAVLNIRTEVAGEKAERATDVSDLRNALQNYDQRVMNQFKDFKVGLEYESGERINSNDRWERRFTELRGAVLVAVRGPGMR